MRLSIVTSLFHSEPYIEEFCRRSAAAAEAVAGEDFEIILVNDGSPDESLARAISLIDGARHIVVVDLSRNFGHHRALMAGLEYATGDIVFLIDVDLEEEPELLGSFYATYLETGADAIYGVQARRKGAAFERISGAVFYTLFNWLTGFDAPRNTLIARLMTRRYVDALLSYRERVIDIAGLWHLTGFNQVPVAVHKRSKLQTTYTLRRKLALAFSSIISFSYRPLLLIFCLGALILAVSAAVIAFYLIAYLAYGSTPSGFTSLILSVWFLGGLGVFSVGTVALYVAVIFVEVKARPAQIVRNVHRASEGDACVR
jgi:putative glycosyltransferase